MEHFCKYCGKEIAEGVNFCRYCGKSILTVQADDGKTLSNQKSLKKKGFQWLKLLIPVFVIGGILYVILISDSPSDNANTNIEILYELNPAIQPVGYFSEPSLFDSDTIPFKDWLTYVKYTEPQFPSSSEPANSRFPGQSHIYSTVVKIVCEDGDYYYYGSGTNVDSAGYVITNLHVLEGGVDLKCIVGFPDPQSGLVREAYWATPILDDENETDHDLAILSVKGPVVDARYNIYGFYEKLIDETFPLYEETDTCLNTDPQLGDQVFALGYPTLSGGALTITDGLISSLFSAHDYLITSAKISRGNSGGLAIDSSGCFVGVPTAVYSNGEDENYGEIIDAYFVYRFYEAVLDDIGEYSGEFGETVFKYRERTSSPEENRVSVYLTTPGALRECASTDCRIIRYYAEGAKVTLERVGVVQNWYEVTAHDDYGNPIMGYMHASLFE